MREKSLSKMLIELGMNPEQFEKAMDRYVERMANDIRWFYPFKAPREKESPLSEG